ncbi:MAG: hypothetical protein J6D28_02805 [Bacilli bacterium]|nr:hypothetical protein [Bacilli bacterium]
MLNQTGVTKVSGTTRKTILVDEMNSTALSIVVGNTGVNAGADGKKIIKAGTPVTGSLTERNTAFTVAKDSDGNNNAVGVILHDVDVTNGEANSQVVIFGFIDISKLDSDVVELLTEAAKKSMRMIQFVK